ncbi:NAD-dependent epimerase/dehydratase family protein [Nocardioides sp. MAH-18]|uniref:NAD-dependent epimerase/dehydratase family protein n=1 Tax=Nocardioides agri TaxID=2682843 RepID=A0A6L6XRF1_9ACTN|nr:MULTISPECIES: nucleoside-diphosphate sugar epimerase/dehydratase [unclassified Nocardioides]MBA2954886.1 polysaccharide biosynthesis protein [Nocardioides sp. CGMCC 1.13656]MVQ49740.1 NAD-dependent epimerase/dehydratase family protein [Nocardioides sp. MAH-18]
MLALWDVACWTLGTLIVLGVRHDFQIPEITWESVLRYIVTAAALIFGIGYATRFYRGRYVVGSFDEAIGLGAHLFAVAVVTIATYPVINPALPRSVAVLTPPLAFLGSAAGRWIYRAVRDRGVTAGASDQVHRVLVYGAGEAGGQVLRLIRGDLSGTYSAVGLLDDNPRRRHLRLQGVSVLGSGDDLERIAAEHDVDAVILAVPEASGRFIGAFQARARRAGLEFLVLPSLSELMGARVVATDIRRVEISDVLGRHQVSTSLTDIADYLSNRRVLITGAGGSIGAELSRQVNRFGPSSMIMLDRDESALHAVQLEIFGHGLLQGPDTVLCDIRDIEPLRAVFREHRPEIVFHAAALKHLPMLERFPDEGWKTNVLGTLNLLELAEEFDVQRFVNISTDKAADPTSVLGSTKRTAEQLTSWHAQRTGRPYISVRFGNVLGSRGSMLATFTRQIELGGPVTVTHPDVERYFMTIPEACELVVQAGALGASGEVMVLEMGEPVKILDVAEQMIALTGRHDIEITFTGLRPGEKLSEQLFSGSERPRPTGHPLIRAVDVTPLSPEQLTSPPQTPRGQELREH